MTKVTNGPDPHLKPVFSMGNKIKRLSWILTWKLLCSWTPIPLHAWRIFILRLYGAKIGKFNAIYPTCRIWAPWLLQTEDVVIIGPYVEIYNPGTIYLSHHAILSQNSYLCGATHDYNTIDFTYIKKPIIIKPYVWICARAIVLPGIVCNEGSVLAAGGVAVKDMESWAIYGGNPAKRLKARTDFINK